MLTAMQARPPVASTPPGRADPSQARADALDAGLPPADALRALVAAGRDRLPLPGSGATLERWRALCDVAARDLSLAKLYEGHTDALAILRELGDDAVVPDASTWGMWAAEAPGARVVIEHAAGAGGRVRLRGRKCWCSGAAGLSHALLTAWGQDGDGPWLVKVALDQPGVRIDATAWVAVGMAASESADVDFDGAWADTVGQAGDYLRRPGFWQGGAGIAACWFGGAKGIAEELRAVLVAPHLATKLSPQLAPHLATELATHLAAAVALDVRLPRVPSSPAPVATHLAAAVASAVAPGLATDQPGRRQGQLVARSDVAPGLATQQPFRAAALGKVDLSLRRTAALLREAAAWIDAHPRDDASAIALRARLSAEETARVVLDETGRALGAAAFCRNARFARLAADLPVFVRQSHAERDFAALGERVAAAGDAPWPL